MSPTSDGGTHDWRWPLGDTPLTDVVYGRPDLGRADWRTCQSARRARRHMGWRCYVFRDPTLTPHRPSRATTEDP